MQSSSLARSIPSSQPWLAGRAYDLVFMISPAFLSSFLVLALAPLIHDSNFMPLWAWVLFVLFIDVSHVYSSLFRTYLNKDALRKNLALLLYVPAICWLAGILLYSLDAMYFWRMLAYLAVFHFIRQQFGFVALYSRKDDPHVRRFAWLDQGAIYAATLYPLIFWHINQPRNFDWFVPGDFFSGMPSWLEPVSFVAFILILGAFLAKELYFYWREQYSNLPRLLIVSGTALSWWTGIVALDSDLAFTITNVVTHGVPYMALVWLYHGKSSTERSSSFDKPQDDIYSSSRIECNLEISGADISGETKEADLQDQDQANNFSGYRVRKPCQLDSDTLESNPPRSMDFGSLLISSFPLFLIFLFVLAYIEEGLWGGLVWREHLEIFPFFASLPALVSSDILAIIVPLLALPQSTHYVLDGFIWRVKDRNSIWSA